LSCVTGTPGHPGASFGVESGQQQTTEQAKVFQEMDLVHPALHWIRFLPKRVSGKRAWNQGAGERQCCEAAESAGGEEEPADDLDRAVEPNQTRGV